MDLNKLRNTILYSLYFTSILFVITLIISLKIISPLNNLISLKLIFTLALLSFAFLQNNELIHLWENELNSMRNGMLELRKSLSASLRLSTNSTRFDFIERHRGMFSLMGLSSDQVTRLREEFGIYMVGDSRINIAGLNKDQIDYFSSSIASVI